MTRKDFELIAKVLRNNCPESMDRNGSVSASAILWAKIANEFATELKGTNAGFDRSRFLATCEPKVVGRAS